MSRELDRLVAEKVLGIHYPCEGASVRYEPTRIKCTGCGQSCKSTRYSEDIAKVFAEVIPAMEARGFNAFTLEHGIEGWVSVFGIESFSAELGGITLVRLPLADVLPCDSPAEAICLAALRAVGVEVDA